MRSIYAAMEKAVRRGPQRACWKPLTPHLVSNPKSSQSLRVNLGEMVPWFVWDLKRRDKCCLWLPLVKTCRNNIQKRKMYSVYSYLQWECLWVKLKGMTLCSKKSRECCKLKRREQVLHSPRWNSDFKDKLITWHTGIFIRNMRKVFDCHF